MIRPALCIALMLTDLINVATLSALLLCIITNIFLLNTADQIFFTPVLHRTKVLLDDVCRTRNYPCPAHPHQTCPPRIDRIEIEEQNEFTTLPDILGQVEHG